MEREARLFFGESSLHPTCGYHLRLCWLWRSYIHHGLLQKDLLKFLRPWRRRWPIVHKGNGAFWGEFCWNPNHEIGSEEDPWCFSKDSLKPTLNSPTFNSLMNVIIGNVIEVITDVNAFLSNWWIKVTKNSSKYFPVEDAGVWNPWATGASVYYMIDCVLPLEFYPKFKRSLRMHTGARSSPCPRSQLWHLLNPHINANI